MIDRSLLAAATSPATVTKAAPRKPYHEMTSEEMLSPEMQAQIRAENAAERTAGTAMTGEDAQVLYRAMLRDQMMREAGVPGAEQNTAWRDALGAWGKNRLGKR